MTQAAFNPRNRPLSPPAPGQSRAVRRAGLVFLLVVLCVLVAGCWLVVHWMQDPQRLPISRLVVTGERHYTRNDDIRQAILSLGTPGTFMTQDVNSIQQQIERLPWIKQVSVRKQWPDELKIHLVEYVPVARWDNHHLIDAEGNVFSVPAQRMGEQLNKLPDLSGPEGSEQLVLKESGEMAEVLAKDHFTLQAAAMTARHSWQLTLSDGIRLNLGRGDRMQRLQRFMVLYPVLQQQEQHTGKQISYVDLRYDSGAAVGWVEATKDGGQQQTKTQAE